MQHVFQFFAIVFVYECAIVLPIFWLFVLLISTCHHSNNRAERKKMRIFQMNIKLQFWTMWKHTTTTTSWSIQRQKPIQHTKYLWKLKIKTAFLLSDYNAVCAWVFFLAFLRIENYFIDKMCAQQNVLMNKKISTNSGHRTKKRDFANYWQTDLIE